MTTDVRTLLHDTADVPRRGPDIDAAMRSARARRRRARGLGALAAVLVVALVTGALVLGGGGGSDGTSVAIGPRQTASSVPDGWQEVHAEPGITISMPADWKLESPSASPTGTPLVTANDLGREAGDVLAACTMHREATVPPSVSGSALTLWEFRGDAKQVTGVDDASLDVVDRPQTFADALVPGPNDCKGARYDQLAFRDAGRVFLVRVVSVFPTAEDEQARLRLAADVLDTLRVDPLRAVPVDGPATTTTPKVATGPAYPLPTITTLPPFVPSTDDERAIVAAFEAWADMHTDADLDATVEDPDAVRAPSHEGWAQQTPENLAAYDGRVDSIDLVDADHARVVYTILYNGQPAYPNRVGSAVRVDGTWKVSTETVCGMLRLGNITCPS